MKLQRSVLAALLLSLVLVTGLTSLLINHLFVKTTERTENRPGHFLKGTCNTYPSSW